MTARKMHVDELDIDRALVGRLLAGQFPEWADLPIETVPPTGTDNAIFRLGHDMAVRLPRRQSTAGQVEKERQWLPLLAPYLPLAIPVPLGMGLPAEGYPWQWGIYPWLPGEAAAPDLIADRCQAATDLARFVTALHRIDAAGGPRAGAHNFGRGVPLAARDANTRASITQWDGVFDAGAVTAAWDAAVTAPVWNGPLVWLHGDLEAGNLLVERGRLSAVIDFGCLGVGDPACDLLSAWSLFTGDSRDAFRAALSVDDATWARGRGWALSTALLALPYYRDTNPALVATSRHKIAEILTHQASGGT